jgi:alpha/beta superfamily hydrolase
VHFDLTGPAGRLEALLDLPAARRPRVAVAFAPPHPDGEGTIRSRVVHEASRALRRLGAAVLRFNYRGQGFSAGTFSGGLQEPNDFRAALDAVAKLHQDVPVWAAGYSFGAWVALTTAATDPRVTALIGIAPPVDQYDFSALTTSATPKFLIQAERDEVCPLAVVRQFYARLPEPRELVVIEGADHAFDGKASDVGDAIEELLGDFDDRMI